MQITVTDLLTNALTTLKVARAGDAVGAPQKAVALSILNELLDAWNAETRAIYTTKYPPGFTLTPALQPHTIGVAANTPTFTVLTARPDRIIAANLVLTGSTVRIPLTLRDDAWWMDVRARLVTSSVPTDLFYAADWPNGSIYLWPIPSTAYRLELEIASLFVAVADADTLDVPQGYVQALRLTLTELLAPLFGQSVDPALARQASAARMRIFGANDSAPNLDTRDGGQPGGRSGFNFLTGQVG